MSDKELNLRAGPAAFSDADCVVPVNRGMFDPLNSRDDLKLLIDTGIWFSAVADPVVRVINQTALTLTMLAYS
jgi:hypothetical protein